MKISLSRFALRTQICAIAAIGVVALAGVYRVHTFYS
ncbi:MAG: hypothetical protein QOG73_4055 [Acetobacteraceae bacterium]|nr:hypothetical protein [Acetobacteraceae bacterium]